MRTTRWHTRSRWQRWAAAAALLAAAGCGGGTTAGAGSGPAPVRVGFSPLTLDFTSLQDVANAMKATGESAGFSVQVADPKLNVQTQVTQLQQWIQLRQVDAIVVIAISPAAIKPLVAQAQAAHIALVIDTQPRNMGYEGPFEGVSFDVTDYVAYGKAVGSLLGECLRTRLAGAQGSVLHLKDPRGQTGDVQTDKAITDSITAAGGVVSRTLAPANQVAAQQGVSTALQAVPGANAVAATNDSNAVGAANAFEQGGKNPARSCIVGGATGRDSLSAINAGRLYGGVSFDFGQDSKQVMDLVKTMHANPSAPGRTLTVPIKTTRTPKP
ncbi:sugar ABC transporter substrate-binding protein [Amycolatopsis sp. WQ 127309]|uniref:sugar ABC transporter substrate-binding protein n=1 Tax=Amycolatopsis sp. WQ 127309 TaxID=2932773 RepID=UPI001FF2CF44|nr:sugar ABC transporter substrate-binding protein [Amycolatopsis sp. WQ 127309]UOZ03436.1 sugar ABC transporter substrate-binding protein [Amycolatopsis sp. WQ 127309]